MRSAIALLILLVACSTGEELFGEGVGSGRGQGGRGSGGAGGRPATSSTKATSGETTSTGMPASSSTGEDVCTPDPDDTPCTKCAKVNCCRQLQQCLSNDNCACWLDCWDDPAYDFFECQNKCGPQGAEFLMIDGCLGGVCFLDCT